MASGGREFISAGVDSVGRVVPFIFCGCWGSAEEESDEGEEEKLKSVG